MLLYNAPHSCIFNEFVARHEVSVEECRIKTTLSDVFRATHLNKREIIETKNAKGVQFNTGDLVLVTSAKAFNKNSNRVLLKRNFYGLCWILITPKE